MTKQIIFILLNNNDYIEFRNKDDSWCIIVFETNIISLIRFQRYCQGTLKNLAKIIWILDTNVVLPDSFRHLYAKNFLDNNLNRHINFGGHYGSWKHMKPQGFI